MLRIWRSRVARICRIVGRPLDAVVGRKVVASGRPVVLAVGLVVLVVVGDEIVRA